MSSDMVSLMPLWLGFGNGFNKLGGSRRLSVAARRDGKITGATPAFAAVSRHNAFSSLLSSLWGSHLSRLPRTFMFPQITWRFSCI